MLKLAEDSEYIFKGFTHNYEGNYPPSWSISNEYKELWITPSYTACASESFEKLEGTIELQTLAEKYSDTLYLTIDDPASASVRFSESYRTLDVSGFDPGVKTEVKFDASEEMTLSVGNGVVSKRGVYQVFKNDEELEISDHQSVSVSVAANDHIKIVYAYPDLNCHVSFNFTDDLSREALTGVTVDGVAVDNFKDGFDAKMGSVVKISGDDNLYSFSSLTLNGEESSNWGVYLPYEFLITEDTEIGVTAGKKPVYTVTISTENADCVAFYRGYNASEENRVALVNGDNQIELPQDNLYMVIGPVDGCEILSILKPIVDSEGVESEVECYDPSWSRNMYFNSYSGGGVEDGMTLKVSAQKIVRNNEFVCYVDNSESTATEWQFYLCRSDNTYLMQKSYDGEAISGYSVFNFGDPKELADGEEEKWPENKFEFAHGGSDETLYNKLYINDELVDPVYTGGTYYKFTVSDKDIVKIFVSSVPEFYNVSFEVPQGVELSVVKDLITEASLEGFQALTGTQVDLKVSTDDGYDLYVNEEKVEAEDDAYSFNVAADTVVKVSLACESGISAVSADSSLNNIYNLQGIKVGTSRNQLPAGIYIINGRKVAVK
jgi:hypothetical protein